MLGPVPRCPPHCPPHAEWFFLSAFDHDQWCSVLQARFHVPDDGVLRLILGDEAAGDPELRGNYRLDAGQFRRVAATFGVQLALDHLPAREVSVFLWRCSWTELMPYLIHGGFELPLLLEGRKKLARMHADYPPATFPGEHRFDHWVAQGVLHREEVVEPFGEQATPEWQGWRTVFYTPVGEEWRIQAMKHLQAQAGRAGGWNESFERLEGSLFGYEDWQNDWWIEQGRTACGIGGMPLCCSVTASGLAWLEAAAFRALPPVDAPVLPVLAFDGDDEDAMRGFLLQTQDSVALVRFRAGGRRMMELFDTRTAGPHALPRERVPDLNRCLRSNVEVVMRR